MAFLGEFLSGKDKTSSTTTSTPNVPQWLKDYYESNTANAASLANATADERVAGFSQDQLKVQDFLSNLLGQGNANYQSGIDSVVSQLTNPSNKTTGSSYQEYMNPYINEVIKNQNNELVRTADINRNKIRDNAAMSNAFGSGRADLMEQEANRNLNQQVSENTSSGMSNAFNWANQMALSANQANTANTSALASTLGSLTGAQTQNSLNQASALNTVGTQQQQLAQSQLDVPYNNVSWLSGILGQIPTSIYGTTTTSQTSTPSAGWGSQLLGAATSAAGLMSGNPALMTGGSSGGGLNAMLQSALNSGNSFGSGQNITWFADGGHVTRNYADGGDTIGASPSSFIDLYRRIKGGYINPALENLSDGLSNFGKPSQVIDPATGKMVSNTTPEPTRAETQAAAYSNVDDSLIKENEAAMAKALAEKQAAAPKTGPVDQERNFMNSILANGDILPPPRTSDNPMEPSSAVTDVTQAAINPVITDTVRERQEPSQSFIEKYLASQSSASTPKEETWMDRVNMPLVLAGAAMMGSNKPFLGAIAEGIGAGAGQIQREKSAKADSESKAKENAQKLLDSLINAQYRNEQIRLGEERLKVSDRAVTVQEKQQAAKEKNAAGNERKAMEFARKQTEAEMKAFEASYDGIKATREQKDAMRSRLQQKYYDDYMAGSFGSGVINELPNSVQSDLNDTSENTGGMLDFNELAKKFSK